MVVRAQLPIAGNACAVVSAPTCPLLTLMPSIGADHPVDLFERPILQHMKCKLPIQCQLAANCVLWSRHLGI